MLHCLDFFANLDVLEFLCKWCYVQICWKIFHFPRFLCRCVISEFFFANISFLGSTLAAASSAYKPMAICGKRGPYMRLRKNPQLVNSAINVSDRSSLIFGRALRSSRQPYIFSKEPYKSLKEPYITKGAYNLQKSPTFSKKSPTYLQKSLVSSKELNIFRIAIHLQNFLTFSKEPYISSKEPSTCQKSPTFLQKNPQPVKRALRFFKRTLNLSKEPYTSCKEP